LSAFRDELAHEKEAKEFLPLSAVIQGNQLGPGRKTKRTFYFRCSFCSSSAPNKRSLFIKP
jgi:hypothetical protein